ncbi:MAG TPA: hypothetical protein VJQ49_13660 [Casimicrobiaceae bacterium]|nr:hypothetical protein [Casimicrobiaceae bacterium]
MPLANHNLIWAKANLRGPRKLRPRMRPADAKIKKVRFWIITMLLVLFGLSTLKLR